MRKFSISLISLLVALGATLMVSTPAHAAGPARTNGQGTTVIFIHGYGSTDCNKYWASAKTFFSTRWTGPRVTYGYYSGDTNCTRKFSGSTSTSIKTVGKDLANWIYSTYSSKGVKVDVVAHSMGGVILRSALTEVAKGTAGYPARLYIEDAVTLGSPHDGTTAGPSGCLVSPQACELQAGSSFLRGLAMRPVSAMGTDWTNIGSHRDGVVPASSATYMNGQHKIQYAWGTGLSHGALITSTATSLSSRVMNNGSAWSAYSNRVGPLQWARNAVYNHSTS